MTQREHHLPKLTEGGGAENTKFHKNSFTIQVSGKRNKKLNINYKSFEKNKIDEDPVITKLVTEELKNVYTKAEENLKVMF